MSASVHAGIHPLWVDPPWADTHPWACSDTQWPVHAGIDIATAADGTHSTGILV